MAYVKNLIFFRRPSTGMGRLVNISRFGLWKLVFPHFITPEYWKKSRKIREHPWKKWENIFRRILELKNFEILETFIAHFLIFFEIPNS